MENHIHHEIKINGNSKHIYDTLLSSEKFSAMGGGAPASIEAKEGSPFTCFGGHITGRMIELVENKRIVQAWRAKSWPEGTYSMVRFELVSDGDNTLIEFDHIGFPADQKEHLESGWHDNYWKPLKNTLVA